jgi:hypothetical protein
MNKIEEYKKEKDGLDVLNDIPRYASEGWQAITDGDKERLKWTGVFFRRQTPGHFMMRVRMPNGITTATQLRAIAEISVEFGKGFAAITTRQQIQLRWFTINDVPQILKPPIILPSVRAIRFRTSRSSKRAPYEYARLQIFPLRIIEITVTASLIGKVYLVGAGRAISSPLLRAMFLCQQTAPGIARIKLSGPYFLPVRS